MKLYIGVGGEEDQSGSEREQWNEKPVAGAVAV